MTVFSDYNVIIVEYFNVYGTDVFVLLQIHFRIIVKKVFQKTVYQTWVYIFLASINFFSVFKFIFLTS